MLWAQYPWSGNWSHFNKNTLSPFKSTRLSLLISALVNMILSSASVRFSPQFRITLFRSSRVMKPSPSASKSLKACRSSAWWCFSWVWDIITKNSLKSMCPLPTKQRTLMTWFHWGSVRGFTGPFAMQREQRKGEVVSRMLSAHWSVLCVILSLYVMCWNSVSASASANKGVQRLEVSVLLR